MAVALAAVVGAGCGSETTEPEDNGGLPRAATLDVGNSLGLSPRFGNRPLTWTVSDPGLVVISPSHGQGCAIIYCDVWPGVSAVVQAIAPGRVTVRVSTEGDRDVRSAAVELTLRGAPVANIRLFPDSLTLIGRGTPPSNQATLRAEVLDSTGQRIVRIVRWSTSDAAVVTGLPGSSSLGEPCCSQSFLAFGGEPGTATLTASAEGKQASAVVRVVAPR